MLIRESSATYFAAARLIAIISDNSVKVVISRELGALSIALEMKGDKLITFPGSMDIFPKVRCYFRSVLHRACGISDHPLFLARTILPSNPPANNHPTARHFPRSRCFQSQFAAFLIRRFDDFSRQPSRKHHPNNRLINRLLSCLMPERYFPGQLCVLSLFSLTPACAE